MNFRFMIEADFTTAIPTNQKSQIKNRFKAHLHP